MNCKRVIERLTVLIVFGLSATLMEYAFLRLMPDSHFIEMHYIQPVKDVHKLGEKPKFSTRAEYKYPGDIEREDIQYCTYEGDDQVYYYNNYVTSTYYDERKEVEGGKRQYDVPGPLKTAKCYIKNITTIELHYGVEKKDIFVTGPYYYGHKF